MVSRNNIFVEWPFPMGMDRSQSRSLKRKATKYVFVGMELHWKSYPEGLKLMCMLEGEIECFIKDIYKGICGGYFSSRATTHKILRFGYYWPTMFSNVNNLVRARLEFQSFVGRQKIQTLLLKHV